MLQSIGKGPRGDGGARGVVARLADCHDRIRLFTAHAVRLGDDADAPADQVREAAAQVLSYFQQSLPHHSADEDESIAPRLPDTPAVANMTEQHQDIHATLEALIPMWEEIAADASKREIYQARLSMLAARLERLFTAHLDLEETEIFPAIEALPQPVQDEIVQEMIARRQD